MKIILENLISAVTASSENTSYPDDNVLDEHPKRVWKGNSVDSASLVCTCSSGADTLALFNTNAENVSISITDPNEIEWELDWDNADWQSFEATVSTELFTQGDTKSIWATFDKTTYPANITVTLSTATGTVIEAGVAIAGYAEEFKDPRYGIQQGLVDYSIAANLAVGAFYYNKLDIVRTFSGTIQPERDTEFYTFMNDFARECGMEPKAIRLTDQDSTEWLCYARLSSMPQGQHLYPRHSSINFSFIEVI